MSKRDRAHLVELAVEEHVWLEYNAGRERHYFEALQKRWPWLSLSHYSMNGADDVIKHKKWTRTDVQQIVMRRPGCTQELMAELRRARVDTANGSFIVGPELPDISSTEVRSALVQGDRTCLKGLLHDKVASWCLENSPYQPAPQRRWRTGEAAVAPTEGKLAHKEDLPPTTHEKLVPQQKGCSTDVSLANSNAAHTLEFTELELRLDALPADQRRAAQSLLGLAIGDSAGLPFEFRPDSRSEADRLWRGCREFPDGKALARLDCLIHRKIYDRTGFKAPGTPFCRGYSDDTACADLKMQAVATFAASSCTRGRSSSEFFRCLMTEYLRWAYDSRGYKSKLFQGTGKFTRDLLHPGKEFRRHFAGTILRDNRQPSAGYLEYAQQFLAGSLPGTPVSAQTGSWGNGAVMSLAPQAILAAGMWQECVPADLVAMSPMMSATHQHCSAQAGAELLTELLGQLYRSEVGAPCELSQACMRCSSWSGVETLALRDDGYVYPIKELVTFARDGDCSYDDARAFVKQLTRRDVFQRDCFGNFGALLRVASNYGETEPIFVLDTNEPVRFSQRGLNTVIIAIWCVVGAKSMLEVLQRVLYVGGDTDTVGAVAGQLAGPLMPAQDICQSFRRFVAMESMQEKGEGQHRSLALASAKRLFCRSLHFVSYDWEGLLSQPPLSDPVYSGLTDASGSHLLNIEAGRRCDGGDSRGRGRWSSRPKRW